MAFVPSAAQRMAAKSRNAQTTTAPVNVPLTQMNIANPTATAAGIIAAPTGQGTVSPAPSPAPGNTIDHSQKDETVANISRPGLIGPQTPTTTLHPTVRPMASTATPSPTIPPPSAGKSLGELFMGGANPYDLIDAGYSQADVTATLASYKNVPEDQKPPFVRQLEARGGSIQGVGGTTTGGTIAPTVTAAPAGMVQGQESPGIQGATTKTSTTSSNATFNPRTIGENETVAGQLNALLADDSKYIQQARANSAAMANERGLLNSSIAAGAGEKAAIEAGLPIAQADAGTFAANAAAAQNAGYTQTLNDQNIQGNLAIAGKNADAALAQLKVKEQYNQAANAPGTTGANGVYTPGGYLFEAEKALTEIKANANTTVEEKQQGQANIMSLISNAQGKIGDVMMQPYGNLSEEMKATQINNINAQLAHDVAYANSIYGLNITYEPLTYQTAAEQAAERQNAAATTGGTTGGTQTATTPTAPAGTTQYNSPSDWYGSNG